MPYSEKSKYYHERQRSPVGLKSFYTIKATSKRAKSILRKPMPKGSKIIIATNKHTGRTVIQSKLFPK